MMRFLLRSLAPGRSPQPLPQPVQGKAVRPEPVSTITDCICPGVPTSRPPDSGSAANNWNHVRKTTVGVASAMFQCLKKLPILHIVWFDWVCINFAHHYSHKMLSLGHFFAMCNILYRLAGFQHRAASHIAC